ncbi:SEC14-like protein 1, partial [Operophtera brumata]
MENEKYAPPLGVLEFGISIGKNETLSYEVKDKDTCPQIPIVVECTITEDSWSADNSQRDTTRRCQLNVDAPYLLKKMIGVDYVYFVQKNHLDLKSRVLEIEATNDTFASRVHPENSEWTCFEQTALLDVKNFFGIESTVEKIAMKQYAANIAKGKELIESFMVEVNDDGVRHLDPWSSKHPEQNRYLRKIVSRGTEPLSPSVTTEARSHSQPGYLVGPSIDGFSSNPMNTDTCTTSKLPYTMTRVSSLDQQLVDLIVGTLPILYKDAWLHGRVYDECLLNMQAWCFTLDYDMDR